MSPRRSSRLHGLVKRATSPEKSIFFCSSLPPTLGLPSHQEASTNVRVYYVSTWCSLAFYGGQPKLANSNINSRVCISDLEPRCPFPRDKDYVD